MKNLIAVLRFYFSTFYALPALKDSQGKVSSKSILKLLGIVVLAIYIGGSFGFLAWQLYANLYKVFASIGIQRLILVYALLYGSVYIILISFVSSFSTIYTNEMEAYLSTLPVRSSFLLTGKAAALAVPEFLFTLIIMGTAFIVYGMNEQAAWLFYINGVLILLLVTLLIVTISYCISIPLLAVGRIFRNRDVTMVVMGFIVMFGVLYVNASINRILAFTEEPAKIISMLQASNETFLNLLDAFPPLKFIVKSLLDAANPVYVFLLFVILAAMLILSFGVFTVLAPLYQRVIQGFSEQYIKKMNKAQSVSFLRTNTGRKSPLMALFLREFRSMNREPVYFLNGPFIIILLPVILGISLYFSMGDQGSLGEITTLARSTLTPVQQVLVSIVTGAFLGSATSITCTSLSRDAKHIGYIKTLPVSSSLYLGAKLIHGMLFGLIGCLVAAAVSIVLFQVDEPLVVLVLASSFVLTLLFNVLGLYIDTVNPQLRWENPVAAMKQNVNAVIMMLLEMLSLGALGFAGFMWVKDLGPLMLFLLARPLL
jgi:ABC-2 type transport system permease protein